MMFLLSLITFFTFFMINLFLKNIFHLFVVNLPHYIFSFSFLSFCNIARNILVQTIFGDEGVMVIKII